MNKNKVSDIFIITGYIISVVSAVSAALYLGSLFLHYDWQETGLSHYIAASVVLVIASLFSLYTGRVFYRKESGGFYTTSISLVLSITVPAAVFELVAGQTIPPWPAIALHGVAPDVGKTAWGRIQSLDPGATGNNSWGQRDHERSIDPPIGKTRIAFIGDSFLEESSVVPVSLLVESRLPRSFEIINLGVSATDPIDYYWRLKNVALDLGVRHVFVFIYMGNDLLESRPADDRGIAGLLYAPLPKSSLLGVLMPSLNYHLAKKYKRSTNVWLADNLHFREQSVLEQFKKLDIGKLPLVLARNDRKGGGRKCYQAMSKLDLGDFYRMLTHPDMGLFRTYILVDAITRFCHPEINRSVVQTGQYTLRMIDRMNDLARENNIGFSVVIVPQGFDVDDRMWSQWKILSDYRKIHKYALAASGLKQKLRERDIHVVDLYPAFRSKRGTYLNVDGHWSGFGNELAAKEIAEEITGLDID